MTAVHKPCLSTTQPESTPETATASHRPAPARRKLLHVLLVVALAWSGVMLLRNWAGQPSLYEGPAPDFTLVAFDGSRLQLEELRGQGVVVNFWASWCGPCRAEAEILEASARAHAGQGIVFVGINYQDAHSSALAYLEEFAISYPNGPDLNNEIARSYGVRAIPDTIFIDPQGNIQGRILGPVLDGETLEDYLDRIRPALPPTPGAAS